MKKSLIDTIYICAAIAAIGPATTTSKTEAFVVIDNNGWTSSRQPPSPTHHERQQQRPSITNMINQNSNNNNLISGHANGRRKIYTRRAAKSNPSHTAGGGAAMEIPNEFSRTFPTDRILKTRKSTTGIISSNSFYPVSIEANDIECVALARRFDLSSISNLSAALQLRPSSLNTGGISSNSIEVEGMCKSIVTQRCVRTNENFEVAVEFPIYCIVRPVIPTNHGVSQLDVSSAAPGPYQDIGSHGMNDKSSSTSPQRKASGTNAGSKKSYRMPDRNIDEMDVMELQRLLQADINADDDTLMEDEAIYNVQDGQIDVGELVAQLFWFKLDPYPKKPGTDPIQRSITG
jgi:hypothetical protein